MFYIYAPVVDAGTQRLIMLVEAKRLHRFDGMHFWDKGQRIVFTKSDTILCWGQCLPPMEPLKVLNASLTIHNYIDCLQQIHVLGRMGVYSPQIVKGSKKVANIPTLPHPLDTVGVNKLASARIMLSPDTFNGYRREVNITKISDEYEIHVFNNEVICVRVKVPTLPIAESEEHWAARKTELAHPWYKSKVTGWKTVNHTGQYMPLSKFERSWIMICAMELARQTGLLSCVVYIGQLQQNAEYTFIRKISLLPELDNDLAEVYAKRIKSL